MGKVSNIEWLANPYTGAPGASWNPWQGCRKVTKLCENCYMFREQKRFGKDPTDVHRSGQKTFDLLYRLPKKTIVFVCSWSDFFIEEADNVRWREEAWRVMAQRPDLFYLIPTKRPQNITKETLPKDWSKWMSGCPNVMFLLSVGTQADMDGKLVDDALNVPGQWGLSVEPMLEPVDLSKRRIYYDGWNSPFEWCIIGGESGPGFREFDWVWAWQLAKQCDETGTPVFIKQAGGWPDKHHDISKFPKSMQRREYPEAILEWLK